MYVWNYMVYGWVESYNDMTLLYVIQKLYGRGELHGVWQGGVKQRYDPFTAIEMVYDQQGKRKQTTN